MRNRYNLDEKYMDMIYTSNGEVYETGWRYWVMVVTVLVLLIFRKQFVLLNSTSVGDTTPSKEPNLIITTILIISGVIFSFFVTKILGIDAHDFRTVHLVTKSNAPITAIRYEYEFTTTFEIPNVDIDDIPNKYKFIIVNDDAAFIDIKTISLTAATTAPIDNHNIVIPVRGTITSTTYMTDEQIKTTVQSIKVVFKSTDTISIKTKDDKFELQVLENEKLIAAYKENTIISIASHRTIILMPPIDIDLADNNDRLRQSITHIILKPDKTIRKFRKHTHYNSSAGLVASIGQLDHKNMDVYIDDSTISAISTVSTISFYITESDPLLIRFVEDFFGNERLLYLVGLISIVAVFFLIKYRMVILKFIPDGAETSASFGFMTNPNHPFVAEVLLTIALVVSGFFSMLLSLLLSIATLYLLVRNKSEQVVSFANMTANMENVEELNAVLEQLDLSKLRRNGAAMNNRRPRKQWYLRYINTNAIKNSKNVFN